MNATQFLLNFADKIEQKEIVNQSTAIRVRGFIRKLEDSTPIELFLIVSGIMGALFCSAGIFVMVGHHWDSYPKYLRAIFSVLPVLIGLYFYYRAIFRHDKSKIWIETSSVFLMLMIGVSIALVGQTYQLEGDVNKFIKIWAVLSLPLFYFARASGITLLYLGLITALVIDVSTDFLGIPSIEKNENYSYYWYLILGFLPHYFFSLDRKSRKQSVRVVYMSYILYLSFMLALLMTIKGNYLLWIATASATFYLIGKRFMGENDRILGMRIIGRPFQIFGQLGIVTVLIMISNKLQLIAEFSKDSFVHFFQKQEVMANEAAAEVLDLNEGKVFYFIAAMLVLAALYAVYFYFKKQFKDVSKLILFSPAFLVLMMLFHEYIFPAWLVVLLINVYVLLIGINALITGNENQNILQMAFGFIVISLVLWLRYFDTDWNFISKGLTFLAVGGLFFLLMLTQKGKIERIERNKRRKDDY